MKNKKALSSVSLSSHSFLHRVRTHRFRVIDMDHFVCPKQNSEGWAEFYQILLQSPTIGACVREIFIGKVSYEWCTWRRSLHESWPCPNPSHRSDSKERHMLTHPTVNQYRRCQATHFDLIFPLLTCLHANRVNYRAVELLNQDDWRFFPTDSRKAIALNFCKPSITTLTLGWLKNLPVSILKSILELPQLTTLLLEYVHVDIDEPVENRDKLYLTNLRTFGFISEQDPTESNMKDVLKLIFASSSQSLRKLTWFNYRLIDDAQVNLTDFPLLKVFSTSFKVRHFGLAIWPLLLKIKTSRQLTTIEVFEFFGMETYIAMDTIEREKASWTEFDECFENPAFAKLREIQFLFSHFVTAEQNLVYPKFCRFCTTEETAVQFKSFFPKACARGVRFTYGLRHDREGSPLFTL
ncbi:hypothetical protein GALMADRAFT_236911 [Galerina marginata CBS 339.88]|uniref:F-box domain-containing protein n=1 Tax=Galerina marginata (strain CBS 339.88) TaxID=685588 RepID=A0A067TPH0_GALM3|nr:hypothetical protein GALMADRAFT_236911 [Galerina marginata CBS 339.88]